MAADTKTCDKSFCQDYLLLSPKDVGLWDLIMLLFSKHIGNRKFIDCPEGTVEISFSYRLVILVSVLAQMFLHWIYKPLAWIGAILEFVLNFMDNNGGLLTLGFNLLRGKVTVPNKQSVTFVSMIGQLDIRKDLDKSITRQDPRYASAVAVMAAKFAYENGAYIKDTVENRWNMEFLGFFSCWNDYEEDYTTQAFLWSDKSNDNELIGVSFRGTSPFNAKDWSSDVDLSWYHLPGIGKVHAGFLKALGLQKSKGWPKELESDNQKPYAYYVIRNIIKDRLEKNPNAKFMVTGHSLGAALSIVFPAILALHKEDDMLKKLEGVYTFGQPRVGDEKFGEYMKEILIAHGLKYHRFVYCNDLVPRVPFDMTDRTFKHFGGCIYYNSFYRGQVLSEEPNKNYFSISWLIPMFINSVWELMRSFLIAYQEGPNYNETFICRVWRLMGLLIAGLAAHSPQDYVNLTRLGSPELLTLQLMTNLSMEPHK